VEAKEHEKATQSVVCIDGGLLIDHAGGCQYHEYDGKDHEDTQGEGTQDSQIAQDQQHDSSQDQLTGSALVSSLAGKRDFPA
jgi:hypothetical protein